VTWCLGGKILSFQAFVRFVDEELERSRFESEVDPFPDAEFEMEREVPAIARTPQPSQLAQEPTVVHHLEVRHSGALDERQDQAVEVRLGFGRGHAVEHVFSAGPVLVQHLGCFPVQFDRF
jgi:hypothetical protein